MAEEVFFLLMSGHFNPIFCKELCLNHVHSTILRQDQNKNHLPVAWTSLSVKKPMNILLK